MQENYTEKKEMKTCKNPINLKLFPTHQLVELISNGLNLSRKWTNLGHKKIPLHESVFAQNWAKAQLAQYTKKYGRHNCSWRKRRGNLINFKDLYIKRQLQSWILVLWGLMNAELAVGDKWRPILGRAIASRNRNTELELAIHGDLQQYFIKQSPIDNAI